MDSRNPNLLNQRETLQTEPLAPAAMKQVAAKKISSKVVDQ